MSDRKKEITSVAAAVYLTVSSMVLFLLQPLYIGAAAKTFDLSAQELGILSTLFAIGAAIGSITMMLLVSRLNWRLLGLTTLLVLLIPINIAFFTKSYLVFLFAQGVAAIGSGSTYSLALACMGKSRNPDRAFGISIAAQVTFQVVGMSTLPVWIELYGINSILFIFILMNCFGFIALEFLPKSGFKKDSTYNKPQNTKMSLSTVLALVGCFFFFANVGVFWTYAERIASLMGLSGQEIGNGLAVGTSAGIIAATAAAWIGNRFGRSIPLLFGAFLSLMALWLLSNQFTLLIFMMAMVIYQLGWNFSLTYQYAGVSAIDRSEKGITLAPAFHGAGAAAGPAIATFYVTDTNLLPVMFIAGLSILLSLGSFLLAFKIEKSRLRI